ncbi:MAG: VWA domain-containing protein, partial [Candidatus Porifericomitaceae bacterium WSBS_2022_MAG_OTU9]
MLALAWGQGETSMMDALSQFHFIRPQWLLGVIPLAWLVWRIGRNSTSSTWSKWCDPVLLPHILLGIGQEQHDAPRRAYWPSKLWLAVAGLLALLAMSGPVWEKQPVPVFPDRSALVVVLSLATDMNVNDVQPNRLAQAKFKVSDLLSRRREGSVALVVYAGDAFVVSPLTDDAAAVVSQLESLDVSIMPESGQRAASAIALASELMDNAGHE